MALWPLLAGIFRELLSSTGGPALQLDFTIIYLLAADCDY